MIEERLCLENYDAPENRIIVNGESLCANLVAATKSQERLKPSGYFQRRKIGLWVRREIFVAVYTDGQIIRLSMLGQTHNLSDSNVSATVTTVAHFWRRFLLRYEQEQKLAFWYLFTETDDMWPERDIFQLVARITESEKSRMGYLDTWSHWPSNREKH